MIKQTFKSPQWVIFFISLGMVVFGYIGFVVFNRPFVPPPGPKGPIFGVCDILCLGSFLVMILGALPCAFSAVWIFIVSVLSMMRRRHPKQI